MKAIVRMILCTLLSLTAFSQIEDGVPPGFDIWHTLGDGNTFYSMKDQPIPSGFFCEESEAFTETLYFEGVPIKTYPAGALGKADTIIERLDFAPYDENGLTYSRMIARALSLKTEPIENACGTWDVAVSLTKNQPVTEVSYVRGEENYGSLTADLVLNFRMVFTLRGKNKVKRELLRTIHFSRLTEIPYAVEFQTDELQSEKKAIRNGVRFDSIGDGVPDTLLNVAHLQEFPTTTVFGKVQRSGSLQALNCHSYQGKQHCFCEVSTACR